MLDELKDKHSGDHSECDRNREDRGISRHSLPGSSRAGKDVLGGKPFRDLRRYRNCVDELIHGAIELLLMCEVFRFARLQKRAAHSAISGTFLADRRAVREDSVTTGQLSELHV